jgi:GNAT superfamily N-acetyltransferase
MDEYTIRSATVDDAAAIARHRVEMFRDMGQVPTDALASRLLSASTIAIRQALNGHSYLGWLAIDDEDNVVAGVGVHVKRQLPRIHANEVRHGPVPLVVNVYTEPAWRGKGIARALMKTVLHWAREQGFDRVVLHASDAARALYESLGFSPTNEMRWSPPA